MTDEGVTMIARRSALLLLLCVALLGAASSPAGAAATMPFLRPTPSAPCLAIPSVARAPEGRVWVRTFAYSAGQDRFMFSALAPDGSLYAVGDGDVGLARDVIVAKYSAGGQLRWQQTWSVPGGSYGQGVGVDAAGSLYVAATTMGPGGTWDFGLVKYSAGGVQQWARTFDGVGTDIDHVFALVVAPDGRAYLTGESTGIMGSGYNLAVVAYGPDGALLWDALYVGPTDYDAGYGICLDKHGDVLVTGTSQSANGAAHCLTLKYSQSGALLWQSRYRPTPTSFARGGQVLSGADSTVYVAGGADTAGVDASILLAYSSAGHLKWARRYDGAKHMGSGTIALAVSSSGSTWLAGMAARNSPWTVSAAFLISYDKRGRKRFSSEYRDATRSASFGALQLAADGTAYCGGLVGDQFAADSDAVVASYDPRGKRRWMDTYDGESAQADAIWALSLRPGKAVYAVGMTSAAASDVDGLVIKFRP